MVNKTKESYMATTALLGFKGFEWATEDGGFPFYFGEGAETPTPEEWEDWLKKALKVEGFYGPEEKMEPLFSKRKPLCWLLNKEPRGKYIEHQPYKYGEPGEIEVTFQIVQWKAYEACKQGFIRRRNPQLGRKAAAYNGEPIPIPGWVIERVNDWAGTQFQPPLPSGKPKPVLKRR